MVKAYVCSPQGISLIVSCLIVLRATWFFRRERSWEILFAALALAILGGMNIAQNNALLKLNPLFQRGVLIFLFAIALEPVGYWMLRPWLHSGKIGRRATESMIEEIIAGAQILASTKTGALIAFERNDGLNKLAQSGTPIDSDVKRELLTAIFSKDALTHDGGVIIQNGRAAYCSAVFPLTFSLEIDKHLGTRHRAAIGLTEGTDAVCLIVSEEEGTISLAKEGKIFYNLEPKILRKHLTKWLKPSHGKKIYPVHPLKTFRVIENTTVAVRFFKSPALQFYDLTLHVLWLILWTNLMLSGGISINQQSLALFFSLEMLVNQPWHFILPALALIQLGFLLGRHEMSFDLNRSLFVKRAGLLFLDFQKTKRPLGDLTRVIVKSEGRKARRWSLFLQDRKKRWLKLDSAGSSSGLLGSAKKIHDLLKIELVNQT